MLKKLLKYEFRSMGKEISYLWYGLLALAVVNRFALTAPAPQEGISEELQVAINGLHYNSPILAVFVFAFISMMIAMVVLTFIFVIQRFYKGLLGAEGYLMHMLPVTAGQHITAKLIGALSLTLANGFVGLLALLLMIPTSFAQLKEMFSLLYQSMQGSEIKISIPLILLMVIIRLLLGILHLYLAMAMGHLSGKNRIAVSAGAFVLINILANLAGSMFANIFFHFSVNTFHQSAPNVFGYQLIDAGFSLILCAVYFLITRSILTKRLNLD